MDKGSHNTLFTTSSEKLFDELNSEDPNPSEWKLQSSTTESREIQISMDTMQQSSSVLVSQGFYC